MAAVKLFVCAFAMVLIVGTSRGESVPKLGETADICPAVDARDTIDSVRTRIAARLGAPIKEETVDTQYVLTFRQKDGSNLFVVVTRENDKLEVNCFASKS